MTKHKLILLIIIIFSTVTRFYRLENPPTYYFDEVYHGVTAKAYALNDPAGYEWWHEAPEPGTAYEWLHPPIGKLLMAVGWKYLGESAWAWRVPGAVTGILVIAAVYWLTKVITNNLTVAVIAAGFASLDGLLLSMSRIGMNDIYVTFFMLLAVGAYWKARQQEKSPNLWLLAAGVCTGLAISTKWSGVFLLGMIGVWELILMFQQKSIWFRRLPILIITFGIMPTLFYLASYGQFWLQGHTWDQFIELHNQIWWYQTHLKATHDYQSQAWEWPLMIRPVWLWVNYGTNGAVANIYNLGNPFVFWFGLTAIIWTAVASIQKKLNPTTVLIILVAYFWSWAPWLLSPRIMFFYHYTPAVPWLAIALGVWLHEVYRHRSMNFVSVIVPALTVSAFIWLSPIWFGLPVNQPMLPWLFWLPSWK